MGGKFIGVVSECVGRWVANSLGWFKSVLEEGWLIHWGGFRVCWKKGG